MNKTIDLVLLFSDYCGNPYETVLALGGDVQQQAQALGHWTIPVNGYVRLI